MRCSRVLKRLPMFAGGDLSVSECAQIDAHIATCFACARAYAQALAARNALLDLGQDLRAGYEPEALAARGGEGAFFARMRDEIVAEAFAASSVPVATRPRRRVWFGSGFLAAGITFLAVGFVLGLFQRDLVGGRGAGTLLPVGDLPHRGAEVTLPVSDDGAVHDTVQQIDGFTLPRTPRVYCLPEEVEGEMSGSGGISAPASQPATSRRRPL